MKRVWTLLLCVLLVLGMTACKKEQKKEAPATTAATTTETTEEGPRTYVHNEVINRFLVRFVEMHPSWYMDTTTINRGKDLSEYTAVINECQVVLTDVSGKPFASGTRYALQITIVGGKTEKSVDNMLTAFALIGMAADSSLSQESAEAAAAFLAERETVENTIVSEYVMLQKYTSDTSQDVCHMDLYVKDPVVTEAATSTTTTAASTTTSTTTAQ